MPLSYFRRPLCLSVLSVMALLCLLRSWGAFRAAAPGDWDRWLWLPAVRLEGEVSSGFAAKRQGDRVRLRITRVEEQAPPSEEEAFVYLPKGAAENEAVRPGQRIALEGRLRRPRWPRVPGDFDEQGFCADRGIAFLFQARRLAILDARVPWNRLPQSWAESAHRSIHRLWTRILPPAEAAVWEGLLLGYVGPLPPAIRAGVQDAGVMHLLVPSGAKMAFVLAVAAWAVARLAWAPWPRAFALAAAGGFYALVVGAEPPYLRAYGCAMVALAARPLGRDPLGFQAVLWSALGILIADPRQLFSAGFQMTYAAILGLMIALPRWKIPGRCPGLARGALRLAMVSFVVQLMLWPLLARIFGRISAVGLLANALLVPLSGIYMAAGFCAWLVGISPAAGLVRAAAPAFGVLARIFETVCAWFAAVPGAAWDAGPMGWKGEAAYYLGALGLLTLPEWGVSKKAWGACAVMAALALAAGGRRAEKGVLFVERGGRGAILARGFGGADRLVASNLSPAELKRTLSGAGARGWLPGPKRLEAGSVRVDFGREMSVVSDGRSQFCILHPAIAALGASIQGGPDVCGLGRKVSTRRDGAVWIKIDELGYSVENQRELYSIGRPLL